MLIKAPQKVVCVFFLKQCALCMQPFVRAKRFTISRTLCDVCAVMRELSAEGLSQLLSHEQAQVTPAYVRARMYTPIYPALTAASGEVE